MQTAEWRAGGSKWRTSVRTAVNPAESGAAVRTSGSFSIVFRPRDISPRTWWFVLVSSSPTATLRPIGYQAARGIRRHRRIVGRQDLADGTPEILSIEPHPEAGWGIDVLRRRGTSRFGFARQAVSTERHLWTRSRLSLGCDFWPAVAWTRMKASGLLMCPCTRGQQRGSEFTEAARVAYPVRLHP